MRAKMGGVGKARRMSKVYRAVRKGYAGWVTGALILLVAARWSFASDRPRVDERASRIQRVVDRLRDRFEIPDDVRVDLVSENPRVVSVQRSKDDRSVFVISVQESFLDALNDDDVEAMVAHELGHVWIFTHHPYLQTEQLANRIAMQHVTGEQLAEVYRKLWGTAALTDALQGFLGVPAASATRLDTTPR